MIVGLDMDNTIVECDSAFRKEAARRLGRSLENFSRQTIRSMVRQELGDPMWTDIQAEVYGPLYKTCPPFDDALVCISNIRKLPNVSRTVIISHKTKYDSAGRLFPLQDFARNWVEQNLIESDVIGSGDVFFCETKEKKIETICGLGCTLFLDDLPDIVSALHGRISHPILFSPDGTSETALVTMTWSGFLDAVRHA